MAGPHVYYCEGCDEPSEDMQEVNGMDLCSICALEWQEAEEGEVEMREHFRASVL